MLLTNLELKILIACLLMTASTLTKLPQVPVAFFGIIAILYIGIARILEKPDNSFVIKQRLTLILLLVICLGIVSLLTKFLVGEWVFSILQGIVSGIIYYNNFPKDRPKKKQSVLKNLTLLQRLVK